MKLLLPLLAIGLIAGHGPAKMNTKISDSDFCFYENTKVAEAYGEEDVYKIDQVLNVSGIDWVFSNFAYGLDNPTHQPIDHKALYSNPIWDGTYNLNVDKLDSEASPFYTSEYKEEYRELLVNRSNNATFTKDFKYFSVIMTEDYLPANFIENITLFMYYSTGHTLGVSMMVKPEGGEWVQLYDNDNSFLAHNKGGFGAGTVPGQTVTIDGVEDYYVRYYDSYFNYNDKLYNNFPKVCGDNPFKFAFVFQALHNSDFDVVLDGIMVNQKTAMKNYLNGILDKNICGNEFDANFTQSFELMDKIITDDDINYLASEYHSDGSTSYYETYKYLKDKLDEYQNAGDSSQGLSLLLNISSDTLSKFLLIASLGFVSIAAYYTIIKFRKSKYQN